MRDLDNYKNWEMFRRLEEYLFKHLVRIVGIALGLAALLLCLSKF